MGMRRKEEEWGNAQGRMLLVLHKANPADSEGGEAEP